LRGFMGMGIKGEGPPNLAATKILGLFM